ncbi:MAG: BolA family transcriptional regulator [Alphaproteobacteria bacterium]|nr:BolA family transcriptional regulator [Alphaproteobacteria bacterium]
MINSPDGPVAAAITRKLKEGLETAHVVVVDESHLHQGHAGSPDGGESHFRVEVVSGHFIGKSRIDRQRLVHGILADELEGPVHALSIIARSPDEAD